MVLKCICIITIITCCCTRASAILPSGEGEGVDRGYVRSHACEELRQGVDWSRVRVLVDKFRCPVHARIHDRESQRSRHPNYGGHSTAGNPTGMMASCQEFHDKWNSVHVVLRSSTGCACGCAWPCRPSPLH